MAGSDTVFAVTNYWEKLDMKLEEQQGRNIADAAKVRLNQYLSFALTEQPQLTIWYRKRA